MTANHYPHQHRYHITAYTRENTKGVFTSEQLQRLNARFERAWRLFVADHSSPKETGDLGSLFACYRDILWTHELLAFHEDEDRRVFNDARAEEGYYEDFKEVSLGRETTSEG